MQRLRKQRVNREKAGDRAGRQKGHEADCRRSRGEGLPGGRGPAAAWRENGKGRSAPRGEARRRVEQLRQGWRCQESGRAFLKREAGQSLSPLAFGLCPEEWLWPQEASLCRARARPWPQTFGVGDRVRGRGRGTMDPPPRAPVPSTLQVQGQVSRRGLQAASSCAWE